MALIIGHWIAAVCSWLGIGGMIGYLRRCVKNTELVQLIVAEKLRWQQQEQC